MKSLIISKLLNGYIDDYKTVAIPRLGLSSDDGRDWLKDKTLLRVISEDLYDKGFVKSEINEIISMNISNETSYRLVAYLISLFDEFTTIDELKKVIDEHPDLDLDDFIDTDLDKLIYYVNLLS